MPSAQGRKGNDQFGQISQRGIEQAADIAGYQVLLSQSHYNEETERRKISLFRQYEVDGCIIVPIPFKQHNKHVFENLRANDTAVVCVDAAVQGVPFDFVGTDDAYGAHLATQHLLKLGHQRIACLAFGDTSVIRTARLAGYRRALAAAKVAYQPHWVLPGPWELSAPADGLLALCRERHAPSAIFAMSDLLAVWAYFRLREAGLRVPEDVSLIGFGGLHEGTWLEKPLTTVAQDREGMGRQAVAFLLQRLQQPALAPRKLLLKPTLVTRATCGAHPAVSALATNGTRHHLRSTPLS
ncbi:MAG: substrate-binding domain-containing protein [bacterium]|nr:substrate-binding domain-containing protein [bacterium]